MTENVHISSQAHLRVITYVYVYVRVRGESSATSAFGVRDTKWYLCHKLAPAGKRQDGSSAGGKVTRREGAIALWRRGLPVLVQAMRNLRVTMKCVIAQVQKINTED